MNYKTKPNQFKIAKGESVSIASAVDIPVQLEKDLFILRQQVKFLGNGEAHVKPSGALLIMQVLKFDRLLSSWNRSQKLAMNQKRRSTAESHPMFSIHVT